MLVEPIPEDGEIWGFIGLEHTLLCLHYVSLETIVFKIYFFPDYGEGNGFNNKVWKC